MIGDLERRVAEIRFMEGVEKVEHVTFPAGDQFWVRFNSPLDLGKLEDIVKKNGYRLVGFASLPSKLPRGLAEMLWDGVTHVVVRNITGWERFTSKLGFEPEGIAKIAVDLHGPSRIFIATEETGIQLLYEYMGLRYLPPAPSPPKTPAPAKPTAPAVAKPATPAPPSPAAPATSPSPPAVQSSSAAQSQTEKKTATQAAA